MRAAYLAVGLAACLGSGCAMSQLFTRSAPRSQEEQIEELVSTIDCNADMLHSDHTPSVHKLIDIGEPVIPRMLDLMLLDGQGDRWTRQHAQTVLSYIISKKHGFESGRGWSGPEGADHARALWKSLGDLDYKAPLEERQRAVKLWREWLAKNKA